MHSRKKKKMTNFFFCYIHFQNNFLDMKPIYSKQQENDKKKKKKHMIGKCHVGKKQNTTIILADFGILSFD